jgi:UPF0716 family protein affecting phage T7 exclusion
MSQTLRWAALLIVLSFTEVAVTVLFSKWLGAALTYSLFAIPTAIGLFLHWHRWKQIRADWDVMQAILKNAKETGKKMSMTDDPETYTEFVRRMQRIQWFSLSLILLLVPGFVTDVLAFCVFFMQRLRGSERYEG